MLANYVHTCTHYYPMMADDCIAYMVLGLYASYDIMVFMGIFSNIFGHHTNEPKHMGSIGGLDYIAEQHEKAKKEEHTAPIDYRNADDDYANSLLQMGAYMLPYHDGVILGINNKNSLVIATKDGGFMLLRTHSQQKHGYMWLSALNRMRVNTDKFTIQNGSFGDEAVFKNENGDTCRVIGHDDDRWYLMAYISVQNEDDNKLFDWFFSHLVINRGEEPMAPNEWLNPELPDDDDLEPVPSFNTILDDGKPHGSVIGTTSPTDNADSTVSKNDNTTSDDDKDSPVNKLGLDNDALSDFQQEIERQLKAIIR